MGNIFRKKQYSVNNFENLTIDDIDNLTIDDIDNYEELINNYLYSITGNLSNGTPPPLPYDYGSAVIRKLT
jgi:hypothetical protein